MLGSIISAATSLIGGKRSADSAEDIADMNVEMQKEFAQNGIRWKVADAREAGIHPLYALGANTTSFSPVNVGDTSNGAGLAQAGQDIGRAIDATRTSDERAHAQTLGQLQLKRAGLENDLLETQIAGSKAALLRSTQSPPMPTGAAGFNIWDGQGNVNPVASEITVGSPGNPNRQPGQITEYQFTAPGPNGTVGLVPSNDAKDRNDDDFIASMLWHLQHRLVAPPAPSKDLVWNPLIQRYVKKPWLRKSYQ